MKTSRPLERHYVLPCCLLRLNLCNEIVAYKARLIDDGLLGTEHILPAMWRNPLIHEREAGAVRVCGRRAPRGWHRPERRAHPPG